jgi:hypothetical protein
MSIAAWGSPRLKCQRGLSARPKCTNNGTTKRETARQRDQAEAIRVAGQNKAHKGKDGECASQHDLIDRAVGAAVLCRHQFGRDREWRRNRKSKANAGEDTDYDQLRTALRQRYQQREERADDDADLHHGLVAHAIGNRAGP